MSAIRKYLIMNELVLFAVHVTDADDIIHGKDKRTFQVYVRYKM